MRRHIIIFLVSVLAAFLAISLFDIGAVFSVILTSDLYLIASAVVLQIIVLLLYGFRFQVISSKYKKLRFRDAFYISVIGNFVSLVTPIAKIGGQPLMIYLTKGKIGSAKASAVVLMDTVIDILVSVLVVVAVVVLFHGIMPYQLFLPLLVFAVVCVILILFFVKLFLSARILSRVLNWITNKVKKIRRTESIFHADVFEDSFRFVLEDKKRMSAGLLISALVKILELLRLWLIFRAIGISLSAEVLLIVWSFMLLLLLIPWLPGSLCLFELGSASAFILLGLSSAQAAGGVILDRFVSFWFVLLFSVAVILLSRHRLGEIMEMAKKK